MKMPSALKIALSSALLLLVASCVSIAGQRFSWFHDQAKDTLTVLIHYDGIHEGTGRAAKGADQIPEFLKNGDILALDWWGHLAMGPIRAKLKDGNLIEKLIAKTLTSFEVRTVGHYTDPGGRIGALQVVTVPKVSRLVKSLNEFFCAAVLTGQLTDKRFPKTDEYQKDAARNRHRWLVLDGHAIRFRLPVHPDEAGQLKSSFLSRLVSRAFQRDTQEHQDLVRRVVRQIAHAPLSIVQEEDMLTLALGYKSRPCTVRVTTRDEYNPALVDVVKQNVPTDLDRKFAEFLIARNTAAGQEPAPAPGLFGDLLRWGPPEDQVGALLQMAATGKDRSKALSALNAFGADWTERGLLPATPPAQEDAEVSRETWAKWYARVTGRKPIAGDR